MSKVVGTKWLRGAEMNASIDWRGMTAEMITSGDVLRREHALDVIERICRDWSGQDVVRCRSRSCVCDYDAKRSILLMNGTLEFKKRFLVR